MDKPVITKKNLLDEVNSIKELYNYVKIGNFNGNVLSVVQVENRTLDFHVHEKSDELFMVLEGSFCLEICEKSEVRQIHLNAGEFVIVPKNTTHRPVVTKLAKFLMIELDGTLNKANSGDSYVE